jgi:hypothetical protein
MICGGRRNNTAQKSGVCRFFVCDGRRKPIFAMLQKHKILQNIRA